MYFAATRYSTLTSAQHVATSQAETQGISFNQVASCWLSTTMSRSGQAMITRQRDEILPFRAWVSPTTGNRISMLEMSFLRRSLCRCGRNVMLNWMRRGFFISLCRWIFERASFRGLWVRGIGCFICHWSWMDWNGKDQLRSNMDSSKGKNRNHWNYFLYLSLIL